MDDEALARTLTEAVRAVSGVTGVYSARPLAAAAGAVAEAVAPALTLREPDVLVDADRGGGRVHVRAGIAVSGERPACDTLRAVGERLRDALDAAVRPSVDLVSVTVRLVEDPVRPAS